ncbi:hypothetical protein LTR10_020852 [Elasticomyces elasticus]|uniref:4-coumarate-CoA ligase n=1 Tax=Exophiala sideris TaxID=1016849 RepID=A0ABR0J804_9EURO|nr:hypothetical protein LTR10_020852 [Elasticomyces elasticus]KAK5025565.1 hypothetical protein LTR13_010404 [Exophiala sideris]KAK5029838.1 hypothetical protein LTS07_005562 [Exophiala sideris]KAK5058401.1 hypothetical protein LTR69_006806 [Exophiala sideris]KAK5178626.1 hypothetical protein LTR44_008997 [Eurotiomycetes sp. CCFEE 6388]
MIFTSDYHIDIPKQDILTFLFTQTPFKDTDPIWLDAVNPQLCVTLSKARELTQRIGQGLRDLGIGSTHGSEDIVLSYIENQVMVAPTTFGVLCAAGIHATCPMTATAFELARQIKLSSPKIVICSSQTRKVAGEAISESGINDIKLLVMMSGSLDIVDVNGKSIIGDRHLQWQRITDKSVLENTAACLVYSSGTTGVPKGVRITHSNVVSNLCQMAFHFDYFAGKAMKEGEYLRMPGIMQNAVVLGITVQTMMALQCGMQVYMFKKFDFDYLIQCIRNYKLSAFFIVPAIWNRISNECSKQDLASFRFCMSGASPLPLPLQLKVQEMLPNGVMLRVNWGMTETTTGAAQPAPTEVDTEGSSGRLLPNLQSVILGADGEKLGVNESGELCVKGPNIIREYFKNPEATKNAFTPDGWFRTGDIAYFSESGKLFIVGRSKELLKYKSHQISPTELEGVLGLYPGIADVGIIGVPDGNANDLPRAYVVISQTNQPGSVTDKDIHEFLNARVSTYKRLRGGIAFVKEVPRNHNGKIMRNVLKEWAEKDAKGDSRAKL